VAERLRLARDLQLVGGADAHAPVANRAPQPHWVDRAGRLKAIRRPRRPGAQWALMRALRGPALLLTHPGWDRRRATRAFAPTAWDAGQWASGLALTRPSQSTNREYAGAA